MLSFVCLNHLMSSWLWQVEGSVIPGLNVQIHNHPGITSWVPAIGERIYWILSIDYVEGHFSGCEVWCYMVAGQYLVDVFVPVVWIIFIQFLKSWFHVFVEYF